MYKHTYAPLPPPPPQKKHSSWRRRTWAASVWTPPWPTASWARCSTSSASTTPTGALCVVVFKYHIESARSGPLSSLSPSAKQTHKKPHDTPRDATQRGEGPPDAEAAHRAARRDLLQELRGACSAAGTHIHLYTHICMHARRGLGPPLRVLLASPPPNDSRRSPQPGEERADAPGVPAPDGPPPDPRRLPCQRQRVRCCLCCV